MKTNVAIGLILALCVLVIGFFALNPRTASGPLVAPAEQNTATSAPTVAKPSVSNTPAAPSAKPTFTQGAVTVKKEAAVASFEEVTMVTTERYPTIKGTANVPRVGIILYNSEGTGLVSTDQIAVENGHWSYNTSVMLPPDTYTIELYGGAKVVTAHVTVK